MTAKTREISRRAFSQALVALLALPLFSRLAIERPDEIVEVNGWIMKRSDLA